MLHYFPDDYYSKTTTIVTNQLRNRLENASPPTAEELSKVWNKWVTNWCKFPLNGFLRSKVEEVRMKLDEDFQVDVDFVTLKMLLPWPEEAITAYSVFSYTEQLDQSLVQFLRDDLGQWWSKQMHHIDGGMSMLPERFTMKNEYGWNKDVHLEENITFNVTVNEIVYTSTREEQEVVVKGYYTTSGQPCEFSGYAAIVTTPLHVIRQIKFVKGSDDTDEFPSKFYQALEDIWYGPSTKIMIQTKTRFWEKQNIEGGFSKTNLPIGQVHYPTKVDDPKPLSDKGILLVYTWKAEALLFGSLNHQVAIREAVRQISTIHPEVQDQFEVGAVQAWYSDPSAQGAYVLLKPVQYHNVLELMQYPWRNVFFAGEGISFAAGWIQGALESGLRAAYQFYSRNEEGNFKNTLQ